MPLAAHFTAHVFRFFERPNTVAAAFAFDFTIVADRQATDPDSRHAGLLLKSVVTTFAPNQSRQRTRLYVLGLFHNVLVGGAPSVPGR